jgi:RHS repeat-associated protein
MPAPRHHSPTNASANEDGTLLAEMGTGGANSGGTTQYMYLPTASGPMPVAALINGVMYAVHSDHLNTPRRVTSGSGQVMWQWAYSAFGETAPTTAAKRFAGPETVPTSGTTTATPVTFNLRYPGQYADSESGLFYNGFRTYNPTTGRYTQPDPIGLLGGWNRGIYVSGNPLGFSDPTGLLTFESWWESSKAGFQSGSNDPWGEVGKAIQGIVPGEGAVVSAVGRGLRGLRSCFTPAAKQITAGEIRQINRALGGTTELTGNAETVIANMAYREGAQAQAATAIRDIAGRHLFDDANKRTAQAVAERLLGSDAGTAIRSVIDRVGTGELRSVEEITRALGH